MKCGKIELVFLKRSGFYELKSILACLLFSFFTISCSSLWSKLQGKAATWKGTWPGILCRRTFLPTRRAATAETLTDCPASFLLMIVLFYPKTRKQLRENAEWIKENSRVSRVELEGHCDPMGSEAYNVGLGLRRAQAVKLF